MTKTLNNKDKKQILVAEFSNNFTYEMHKF
jgi:hypothetical protein